MRDHFYRQKRNGQGHLREWLVFTPSNGCYCCKLFLKQPFISGHNWKQSLFRIWSADIDWQILFGGRYSTYENQCNNSLQTRQLPPFCTISSVRSSKILLLIWNSWLWQMATILISKERKKERCLQFTVNTANYVSACTLSLTCINWVSFMYTFA